MTQGPPCTGPYARSSASGCSASQRESPESPPNTLVTATRPTVSSATSFTSDSKAMATPSPAWRSRGVT